MTPEPKRLEPQAAPAPVEPTAPIVTTPVQVEPISSSSDPQPAIDVAPARDYRPLVARGLISAAVGLVAAGVVGLALAVLPAQVPSPPAATGVTTTAGSGLLFAPAAESDRQLTDRDWEKRSAQFAQFQASMAASAQARAPMTPSLAGATGKLPDAPVAAAAPALDVMTKEQAKAYINAVVPPGPQREKLLADHEAGKVVFRAVGLMDDVVVDGDVVRFVAGPVDVVISLNHQVQYAMVPVSVGGPPVSAQIIGVTDGGGAITASIVTPGGQTPLPRLEEGGIAAFYVY